MKFERSGKMLGNIAPVVTTWIQMEFVGDVVSVQQVVKRLSPGIESVFVLRTAIKIDL